MKLTKKQRSILFSLLLLFAFSMYSYITTGEFTNPLSPSQTPTPVDVHVLDSSRTASDTARVTRIIDGDTIEVNGNQTIRYIGIDTPETVDPRREVQCFGQEASEKNKDLVLNKTVRLEKDVSETDRYGRLLRYVFLGDEMINETLVREGFAQSSAYPPDVLYQSRLDKAEAMAREEQKGLWGSC